MEEAARDTKAWVLVCFCLAFLVVMLLKGEEPAWEICLTSLAILSLVYLANTVASISLIFTSTTSFFSCDDDREAV